MLNVFVICTPDLVWHTRDGHGFNFVCMSLQSGLHKYINFSRE